MDGFISYLFYAFYFLIIVILAFFIPGNLFLKNFKLSPVIKISSSILLGISLWAIQGFIFGYLNLRDLTYLYLLTSIILWLKLNFPTAKPNLKFKLKKEDLILASIFTIGVGLQIISVIANAIPTKEGLYFCCGGADALYHAALTNELVKNFPPNEPGIVNIVLKNYHFLSNLVTADLIRVFKLPLLFTEFQLIPILMSMMLGLSAYSFASILKLGKTYIIFFLILIFFFSDIFYLLTLLTAQKINFEVSSIETSLSLWVSYTRYFGIVLFFQALTFLLLWMQNKRLKYLIPLLLVGGTLIGFKIYIGILFLSGAGLVTIYFLIKRGLKSCLSLVLLFLISAVIFLPVNSGSGGLIFTGFWRVRDFIATPDLNLVNLELARQIFATAGNTKSYFYDLLFFIIYLLFSFGILSTAFANSRSSLQKIPFPIHIFLISGFIFTFILGMFFIQKTGGANTSQFLISSYLIGSIYAALFLNYLYTQKNVLLKLIVVILILLTLPKTIHMTLFQYNRIAAHDAMIVTNDTLEAFKYIKDSTPGNSVFIVDPKLGNVCILLPFMTTAKSYSCDSGSPVDRGLDLKEQNANIKNALGGKSEIKNKKFDYILTMTDKKNSKRHKVVYRNSSLMVLTYE